MATPKTAPKFQLSASLQTPPPPVSSKSKLFLFLLFAVFALSIDQLTKVVVPFFGFTVVENTGVSFGLLGAISPLVIAVVLMALILWLYRSVSPIWLGVMSGAAASNVFDRLLFGGVRDWLPVPLLGLRNNLADWLLCIAILAIVVQSAHGPAKHAFPQNPQN